MNYVAYYRVSTQKQGDSGLSLESQRQHVRSFVRSKSGNLLGEFQEVASGGQVSRKVLAQAIKLAHENGATIVVKRLDRLSRDGFRISTMLEDMGVSYIDCESPNDSDFVKNIKLAVAKEEKEKISQRIRSALDVIKENLDRDGVYVSNSGNRITKLGNEQNLGGDKAIKKSISVRKAKALSDPNNIKARAVINMMRGNGDSYYKITKFLNDNGFKTSRGNDFSQVQVKNLHTK